MVSKTLVRLMCHITVLDERWTRSTKKKKRIPWPCASHAMSFWQCRCAGGKLGIVLNLAASRPTIPKTRVGVTKIHGTTWNKGDKWQSKYVQYIFPVLRDAQETAKKVRQEKWLEWLQTSFTKLWQHVKWATSHSSPWPLIKADREQLATSTSSVRACQESLYPERLALIRDWATKPDASGAIFFMQELRRINRNS